LKTEFEWKESDLKKWIEVTTRWVSYQATESNPVGLTRFFEDLYAWLQEMGFELETHTDSEAPYRPVIIAKKAPVEEDGPWLGFFQHYDVEPIHEEWETDPWELVQKEERVYGRGIADNIGPLAHRLIMFENMNIDIGLLLVIQGEEEIGSPWAHELLASIELPEVVMWIDETGYFYKNGDQRLLRNGNHEILDTISERLVEVNDSAGIRTNIRSRYLTKAFGLENCPCIAHLLGDKPYLAIGPNDDKTAVHGPDESMDVTLLPICTIHLQAVINEVEARC
jgi:acetylornithine deacetylase/succinyl-diaminopimelate desuccinylase-like protein